MVSRHAIIGISLLLATATQASGPTLLGQLRLDYVGQSSNDGAFEWQIDGTSTNVFTYCFSTSNLFDPSAKPQVFNVWSIAGSTAAEVTSSGMLSNNAMSGLTPQHFLEAAAQAVAFGAPGISDPVDTAKNAAIHDTESNGNVAFSAFDNLGTSDFYYLQQANPQSYAYGGQPQGLISSTPPVQTTPEPASLAALGVGAVALFRRRSKK